MKLFGGAAKYTNFTNSKGGGNFLPLPLEKLGDLLQITV